ncbi:DNA translocase FtsK [Pseudomonas chlororaphis]|uniref:DNA translocase FtsK n=1 Tax=Pseudomonas chlororaphis TaxID=587753 RepID=UPI000F558709|nr:DNA translocase FtsK [Pseudomonas chlororaphis]AZD50544.1 DNA translocase FtsK [Pseudomonas chlororaphis subsp. aurantiaca]
MKMEHKAIIERASLLDVPPSYLAHELLVHDLVNAGLFELKNLHSPYGKLNEGQQQEVIDRLTEAANAAVHNAISIISSRNVSTIEVTMKEVKFNSKQLTLTSIVDAKDPNRHDLIDSAGRLCLLVMAPDDYNDGLDFIQPDRDQPDLPLHASELTGSLFDSNPDGSVEVNSEPVFVGHDQDPLYAEAVQFVIETRRPGISAIQRKLKVGYNRAARMLEWMENQGIVTPPNTNGGREVLLQSPPSTQNDDDVVDAEFDPGFAETGESRGFESKEFGEFTYEDAAQLIVVKATTIDVAWLQHRLAISSDQATTLLLRLVDNEVIQLETEAEQSIDNTYTVIAKLEDLGSNLNLE